METDRNWNERVVKTTQQAKEQVRSLADVRREQVAGHVRDVARAFRNAGEQLRENNPQARRYTEMIGEKAEKVSQYLEEHDASVLINDVERFARNNPLAFLGGCMAVGFAIGRFFRASPNGGGEMPLGVAGEPSSFEQPPTYPQTTYQESTYQQPYPHTGQPSYPQTPLEPSVVTTEVNTVGQYAPWPGTDVTGEGNGRRGQEG